MKKVTKTTNIPKEETVYIACDGKTFNYMYECMRYEFEKWIYEDVKNSPNISYNDNCYIPCDGLEHMENNEYMWLKPNNIDGLNEINEHIKDFANYDVDLLTDNIIGAWICVEFSYDNVWLSTLDESIEYINGLFERLGDPRRVR